MTSAGADYLPYVAEAFSLIAIGTQRLGALFGVCFLGHQIGAFLGTWLGGFMFDMTGSYTLV